LSVTDKHNKQNKNSYYNWKMELPFDFFDLSMTLGQTGQIWESTMSQKEEKIIKASKFTRIFTIW